MKRHDQLQASPEAHRAWQDRTRAKARERARETRGKPLGERKGQRRIRAPLPLPPADGSPSTLRGDEGKAVAFGAQAALCRTLPCSCGCARVPCDPHHEPPRSCGGSDADTLPLFRECHDERHRVGGRAFWASRGRDPLAVKAALRESLAPVVGAEGGAGCPADMQSEPGSERGVIAPARASTPCPLLPLGRRGLDPVEESDS